MSRKANSKGADKILVVSTGVDATPRRSALINERVKAKTLSNLEFSEPLCKAFDMSIPAIDAGATQTYTFNMGNVDNIDVALMSLYPSGTLLSDTENFSLEPPNTQLYAFGIGSGIVSSSPVQSKLTNKYIGGYGSSTHASMLRITDDYNEARLGYKQVSSYDEAGTATPKGFSYAEMGVGVTLGWGVYFGTAKGFAEADKKIVLQSAHLEQDGENTNVVIILKNVDSSANTPLDVVIAFYL
jgi:hypothetical protein